MVELVGKPDWTADHEPLGPTMEVARAWIVIEIFSFVKEQNEIGENKTA